MEQQTRLAMPSTAMRYPSPAALTLMGLLKRNTYSTSQLPLSTTTTRKYDSVPSTIIVRRQPSRGCIAAGCRIKAFMPLNYDAHLKVGPDSVLLKPHKISPGLSRP